MAKQEKWLRLTTLATLTLAALCEPTGLRYSCPKALGTLKFAQPTWPAPRSVPTCPRAASLTCCGAAQDDYLARLHAVCSAQGASERCCAAWTALSCAACDGFLALGLRPGGVCPSLCDATLAACADDWVSVDPHSGAPSACTPDSLICPRFGDAFASGEALCRAMGLPSGSDASSSDALSAAAQQRCYDGLASSAGVPVPARLLAAIANESASLGVQPDGTPAAPEPAPLADLIAGGFRALLRGAGVLEGPPGQERWSALGAALAVGAAIAAVFVLRRSSGGGHVTDVDDDGSGGGHTLGGGSGAGGIGHSSYPAADAAGLAAGRPAAPSAEFLRAARLARFASGGPAPAAEVTAGGASSAPPVEEARPVAQPGEPAAQGTEAAVPAREDS